MNIKKMETNSVSVVDAKNRTCHFAISVGLVLLLAFTYSFLVSEPASMGFAERHLETEHYQFVMASRWWFLGTAVALILFATYSLGIAHNWRKQVIGKE